MPERQRIIGYGWFYIIAGIGLGIGAVFGFLTAAFINDHFNFYVITGLFILALIYLIFCFPESLSKKESENKENTMNKHLFKNPLSPLSEMCKNSIIKWIGFLYLFINLPDVGIAGIVIPVFSDVYVAGTEAESNKLAILYLGGLSIGLPFSSIVVLPILKKCFNDYSILVITTLILAFSMICMSLVLVIREIWMVPIVGFIFGHSYICLAASNAILSKYTSPNQRGLAFGVVAAMTGITNIIAPTGFAFTYHFLRKYNMEFGVYIIALILVIFALIIVLIPLRNAINGMVQIEKQTDDGKQDNLPKNNYFKSSSSLGPGAGTNYDQNDSEQCQWSENDQNDVLP